MNFLGMIDFATGNVVVFSKQADGSREKEVKTTLKDCYGRANKTIKWVEAGNGQYTFENNSYHTLDFFYLERGKGASNMQLKYNLLEVPESSIIKQDQIGQAVPGAEFELWSGKGQEQKDTLLAKGTTNHDGTFILMDARVGHENKILSLMFILYFPVIKLENILKFPPIITPSALPFCITLYLSLLSPSSKSAF